MRGTTHWFRRLSDSGALRQADEWERLDGEIRAIRKKEAELRERQLVADLMAIDRSVGRGSNGWSVAAVLGGYNATAEQRLVVRPKPPASFIEPKTTKGSFWLYLGDFGIGTADKVTIPGHSRPLFRLRGSDNEIRLGMTGKKARAVGMICRYYALDLMGFEPDEEQDLPGWQA